MGYQSDPALIGCTKIASITIGKEVETIPDYAFKNLTKVEQVTIPYSVRTIGAQAFSCYDYLNVYTQWANPADPAYSWNDKPFSDAIFQKGTLYVPLATKAIYEQTAPWMNFLNIVEYEYSGIKDIESDVTIRIEGGRIVVTGADDALVQVFGINGTTVYCGSANNMPKLPKGFYIVRVGKLVKKVAIAQF